MGQEPAAQPIQIGGVTFSGSVRERYEVWNWFEPASGNNLYGFSGTVVRFGFSQKHEHYDWNLSLSRRFCWGCQTTRPTRRHWDSTGWADRITRRTTRIGTRRLFFRSRLFYG